MYTFNFDQHRRELYKLESRHLFGEEPRDKILFSKRQIDPSISAYIKNRIEIIDCSENYSELLNNIKDKNFQIEGFKIEYLLLNGDSTNFAERRNRLKDVGHCIEGIPNFDAPTVIYALCYHAHIWYFGFLAKQNTDWQKHKQKPRSFSNSIDMYIAKTLVSIASKGIKSTQLLDACCGVGTVMLEACFSGFKITGCDINPKACDHTKQNLVHFDYSALVFCSDIKDHDHKYDAIIIDLPYNLYSYSNDGITLNIISSAAKLSARIVIVSISDIEPIIKQSGLNIADFCAVEKRGRSTFQRNIWVCEKDNTQNS